MALTPCPVSCPHETSTRIAISHTLDLPSMCIIKPDCYRIINAGFLTETKQFIRRLYENMMHLNGQSAIVYEEIIKFMNTPVTFYEKEANPSQQ